MFIRTSTYRNRILFIGSIEEVGQHQQTIIYRMRYFYSVRISFNWRIHNRTISKKLCILSYLLFPYTDDITIQKIPPTFTLLSILASSAHHSQWKRKLVFFGKAFRWRCGSVCTLGNFGIIDYQGRLSLMLLLTFSHYQIRYNLFHWMQLSLVF